MAAIKEFKKLHRCDDPRGKLNAVCFQRWPMPKKCDERQTRTECMRMEEEEEAYKLQAQKKKSANFNISLKLKFEHPYVEGYSWQFSLANL